MRLPRIALIISFAAYCSSLHDVADAQISASAYTTGTRYDPMGRVTGVISPDPDSAGALKFAATRNTYDASGRLVRKEIGELANWKSDSLAPSAWGVDFVVFSTTEISYDSRGRKTVEILKGSDGQPYSVTQFSYDVHDRLECSAKRMNPAAWSSLPASACSLGPVGTDGEDRITKTSFDTLDRTTTIQTAYGTPVQSDSVAYTYFGATSQPASIVDARGFKASMTYDGFGRRSRWYFPNPTTTGISSTTDFEQYGYDAAGNRTSIRKRDGSTLTYQYDDLNRLLVKVVPPRAYLTPGQTRDVYYEYDLRGLMLKARFDSLAGEGITNTYDGRGLLTSSSLNLNGLSRTLAYAYDLDGGRTELTHNDGQKFTYARDGLGRVVSIYEGTVQGSTTRLAQIQFDSRGLIDTVQRSTNGNAFLADLTFNAAGQLSSLFNDAAATNNDLTVGQTFNAAGQIRQQTRSNDTYSWSGAVAVNRNYLVNGLNQYSSAGASNFAHDLNGNLVADGGTTFIYDVENRLVSASGAAAATLTYDPLGRLFETSAASTGIVRYQYDGDELVAEFDSAGTLNRRYVHSDNVDEPLVQYDGNSVGAAFRTFLMNDERGSIVAMIYNDGSLRAKNTYDEYGIPGSVNQGRFQYTGQAWIPGLGMYHYKARIYSALLGRFLQTDPVGYGDQINLYAYARNDPIGLKDSAGEDAIISLIGRPTYAGAMHVYLKYWDPVAPDKAMVSAAMPVPAYNGIGVLFGADWPSNPGPGEDSKIVVTNVPAQESGDDTQYVGKTVVFATVRVKDDFAFIKQKAENFAEAVNRSKIVYLPFSRNSNTYGGDAFQYLTGKRVIANEDKAPGINENLQIKCASRPGTIVNNAFEACVGGP